MSTTPVSASTTRYPGGCLQPVLLRGSVDHIDGATGELLHRYTTVHEPGGVLPIPESALREFITAGVVEPLTATDIWPTPWRAA